MGLAGTSTSDKFISPFNCSWRSRHEFAFHILNQPEFKFQSIMKKKEKTSVPTSQPQQSDVAPPDGGWGWVVAIGACIVQMQVATTATSFGVYFAHLTTGTRAMPASVVSSVPSIMAFIMFFFCPISTALSKHYGTRPIALAGALLVTGSTAMAAVVDNFYWFFFFFSVAGGVGCGLILVQGNVTVQQYFLTKRATANGIFMSGGSLGNMTMPIILRHSLTNFGFQPTVLLHAAFMALTIPAALTFRPVSGTKQTLSLEENLKHAEEGVEESNSSTGASKRVRIWLPNLNQIFIWKILKNPLFLVLTFSVITGRTGLRGFGMLVPAFGESIGLGKETSTYLLTIMAFADFASRIFLPLLTDLLFPNVKKKYFFIICIFFMSVSLAMFGLLVNNLETAIAFSVLIGLSIGGVATFMNVIFAESMGIDSIQDTIGLMYLMTGLWTLPVLPLLGLIRDLTGDYRYSFLGLAASLLAGTAVWVVEPYLRQFGKEK